MTLSAPDYNEPQESAAWGPSAEIIPFPFRGRTMWVGEVCHYFEQRRGAKQKRAYVDKLVSYHRDQMQRLGVTPERIDAEISWLESLFFGDAAQTLSQTAA